MFERAGSRPSGRVFSLAAIAVLGLTLAACGAGESSAGSSEKTSSGAVTKARAAVEQYTSAASEYPQVKPAEGFDKLSGKTVWYVPFGAAVPILKTFGDGMVDALSQVGAKVHVCDGKFVPTAIAACLSQAGTSGADAVVTGYVDYQLVPTAFDALVAKGVPVLLAGTVPPSGKSNTPKLAFDDTSPAQNLSQELTANAIIADSNGNANILYLGVTDSPALRNAADHAAKFYADNCPSCTVTRIDYSTASISKLASEVSAALIKAPKTSYIMGEVDASAAPAIAGSQSAGFGRKVKYAATGADLDALQRISKGNVQFMDTGVSAAYLGWRFADGVLRMMAGEVPSSDGAVLRVFNQDNLKGLDLTPAKYATNEWYGSDDFKVKFLDAWGVK